MMKKAFKILGVIFTTFLALIAMGYYLLKDQVAIMEAVIDEDKETFAYYIDKVGFNPNNLYGDINLIVFFMANNTETNNIEFIEFMINKGVDINNINTKWNLTPVLSAIVVDRDDIIELFIKNNADVNSPNIKGITPLGGALRLFNCEISKQLIDAGATLNNDNNHEKLQKRLVECKDNNWVSVNKIIKE